MGDGIEQRLIVGGDAVKSSVSLLGGGCSKEQRLIVWGGGGNEQRCIVWGGGAVMNSVALLGGGGRYWEGNCTWKGSAAAPKLKLSLAEDGVLAKGSCCWFSKYRSALNPGSRRWSERV